MTGPSAITKTRALLLDAEPQIFVADIAAASDFYAAKLGFTVAWLYGTPPYYGQVERDGIELDLRCVEQPPIAPALRDRQELLAVAITLATRSDLESLATEYRSQGVEFFQEIEIKPWGAVNFIVRDLDGNLLLFAGPA